MNTGVRGSLVDVTTAFLIGAGLGVAAAVLLRPARRPPRRLARRVAGLRPLHRDLRTVLASLRDR